VTIVSKSVFISRPPAEVFAYLADFANTAEWDPGIVEATQTSEGDVGLGATFDLVSLFLGRRVPVTYQITEYDPPQRAVIVGRAKNFTGTDTITVSADGDRSRVGWSANFEMRGLGRLIEPFLKGTFEKLSDKAMEGLRQTLNP
jgi:carbon monoxide dehydrogenase subunit G